MGKRRAVILIALSLLAGSAWARDADDDAKARNRATEIDTEHIFGLVEGDDIGERAGVALSGQLRPGVFLGAEARYLRSHEGLVPAALKGEAVFLGPTFYAKLMANSFISVAWSALVAGRAVGEAGALDLTNFERHQVRFRLGIEF